MEKGLLRQYASIKCEIKDIDQRISRAMGTDSLVMMDNETKKITHQLEEANKELVTLQIFKETALFE